MAPIFCECSSTIFFSRASIFFWSLEFMANILLKSAAPSVHCTVSIQMLISISTIKENIQLTKIRVSQFLERDIFLHVYTLLENPELRFILQASKEVLGFTLQKKIPPLHKLTEEWTSFWNWMFTCTLY